MRELLTACLLLFVLGVSASAQKTKPWTEWTVKDAQKMLTDSGWAQTQTELSDAETSSGSAITRSAENQNSANMVSSEASKSMESGENIGKRSASLSLNYRVAFLSARPVRQAFIRMIELQKAGLPPEKIAELRTFVDRDFGDYVVVTINLDGSNRKKLTPAMQEIGGADATILKNTTYLERKDGKRVSLMDYRAPGPDGMGAKFVFPRSLDGKPFIDANSGEVRVYIEVGKTIKVSRRFKVSEMMYEGKLEF